MLDIQNVCVCYGEVEVADLRNIRRDDANSVPHSQSQPFDTSTWHPHQNTRPSQTCKLPVHEHAEPMMLRGNSHCESR